MRNFFILVLLMVLCIPDSANADVSSKTIKILKYEEGFRAAPYLDTLGYLTVGYGYVISHEKGLDPKKSTVRVTEEEATIKMKRVMETKIAALKKTKHGRTYRKLSSARRTVIDSMTYQMGVKGIVKFEGMWKALKKRDYDEAAIHMMDSTWQNQTGNRALRHAMVMATGSTRNMYGF